MYWLVLQDLMFLIKSIKYLSDNFNNTFTNSTTRASRLSHLQHNYCCSTTVRHFYFSRIASLWNSLVSHIDLNLSIHTIKRNTLTALWEHFVWNFDPNNPCTFHCICPCSSCSIIPHLWLSLQPGAMHHVMVFDLRHCNRIASISVTIQCTTQAHWCCKTSLHKNWCCKTSLHKKRNPNPGKGLVAPSLLGEYLIA